MGGVEDGEHWILLVRDGRLLLLVVAVPGACDHQWTTEEKAGGSISSGRGRGRGGLV